MDQKAPPPGLADLAREVVRFDRFYSQRLCDATNAARVNEVNAVELGVFLELLVAPSPPGWLSWRLRVDPSYLSRTLKQLEIMGFVTAGHFGRDGRQRQVSLTGHGRAVARSLQQFQEDAARGILRDLPARKQRRLVRSMQAIIEILEQDAVTNFLQSR